MLFIVAFFFILVDREKQNYIAFMLLHGVKAKKKLYKCVKKNGDVSFSAFMQYTVSSGKHSLCWPFIHSPAHVFFYNLNCAPKHIYSSNKAHFSQNRYIAELIPSVISENQEWIMWFHLIGHELKIEWPIILHLLSKYPIILGHRRCYFICSSIDGKASQWFAGKVPPKHL